jgi:hypothetical protein
VSQNFGKLLIGASMAIGMGALAANPVQAGTLTGISVGGSAASDYHVYGSDGTNTVKINNPTAADLQNALTGNAASPTGNVELRASSEQAGFNATEFAKNTTLEGQIGGKDITLSSLTASDWATVNYKDTGKTFGEFWFNQFYNAAGLSGKENAIKSALGLPNITPNSAIPNLVFNVFKAIGGLERSSDPNISYVNQDDTTGLIKIGLAGHLDLKAAYLASNYGIFASLLPNGFQASEVVKYTYNGVNDYLYSFQATTSGLTDIADGVSHNGNYEVTIDGVPPTTVPEPSVMLGVLGVAGVFAAQRKLKKVSTSA